MNYWWNEIYYGDGKNVLHWFSLNSFHTVARNGSQYDFWLRLTIYGDDEINLTYQTMVISSLVQMIKVVNIQAYIVIFFNSEANICEKCLKIGKMSKNYGLIENWVIYVMKGSKINLLNI